LTQAGPDLRVFGRFFRGFDKPFYGFGNILVLNGGLAELHKLAHVDQL
jgi:hypothetical protein